MTRSAGDRTLPRRCAVDGTVRHHAARLEVPSIVSLAGATHRLGEHQHLESIALAAGACPGRYPDIAALLDVSQIKPLYGRHRQIVVQQNVDFRALASIHAKGLAVHRGDGATDASRWRVL